MVSLRKTKRLFTNFVTAIGYAIIYVLGLHHFGAILLNTRKSSNKVYRTPVRMPYANDIY